MSEYLPADGRNLVDLADFIAAACFKEVAMRYGAGETGGTQEPAQHPLAFHNLDHTVEVTSASKQVAEALGLQALDVAVAVAAGASHDVVQLEQRGVMELESFLYLAPKLYAAGFNDRHIRAARLAITGTEPTFDRSDEMIGQMVTEQDYPDKISEMIAQSVACADMSELYSAHGPLKAHRYYQELHGVGMNEVPDMDGLLDFQCKELRLLDRYEYPHPLGERLFGGAQSRRHVFAHQSSLTEDLRRGTVTSWQQVIQRDIEYAYAHL